MYLDKAKTHIFNIINLGACFVFICSTIFPASAFASRSDAGGGEVAEFDVGDIALSAGLSLGSMAIGSAINAGISSLGTTSLDAAGTAALAAGDFSYVGAYTSPGFFSAMGDSFAKSFSVNNMISGLSTFGATSQVGRAVGAAGQYYGWDPSTTFLASNIASAATGGFLNPSVALATSVSDSSFSTMARGATVGGLTGLASGAAIVAIDGDRMNDRNLPPDERRPGVAAQIAGMAAGVAAGNFSRALVSSDNSSLADATFIKAADMPRIAARSLAIVASNSVDKDNKFFTPSTVSYLVEGAALPAFKRIADPKDSFSLKEMGYGLVEGAVHGGTSYLISRVSNNDSSLARATAGYGATLVSGAVRGAVQEAMWNPNEITNAKTAIDKKEDITNAQKEEMKIELSKYNETMKGGYSAAILTSMGKANSEFIDRTFAFGAPRGNPREIDSLAMVDYFSKLNTYATAGQRPDWFATGLNSSMTNASTYATSNDLFTTLGAFNTPFTRDTLNIPPFTYQPKKSYKKQ